MGTNYLAPTWRQPENANKDRLSNYSLYFDGSSHEINCGTGSDVNITGPISISVWFNADSTEGARGIVCKNDAAAQQTYAQYFFDLLSGEIRWRAGRNTVSYGINTGQWYHAVGVYDGSDITLYIDGTPVATDSALSDSYASAQPMYIGRRLNQSYFEGEIGQVCIFDYAINQDQVTYLYNLNNPLVISGAEPIAYWPLGDNSNPTANPGYPNIVSDADSVFDFGASNEEIDAPGPYADGTQGDLTISAWVKQDSITTSYNPFICTGFTTSMTQPQIAMALRNVSGNRLYLFYNGGGGSNYIYAQDVMTEANRWYHCAFVRNGSTGKLYVDGQEVPTLNSANFSINPLVTTEDSEMTLGAWRYDGNITSLNGELSNVCLWKTALTDGVGGQIEELYNNGLPLLELSEIPQDNNLLAWYKLNQSAVLTPGITAEPWRVSVATGNPDYTNTDDGAYTFNGEFRCRDTGAYDFSDSFYLTFRTITGAHNNITLTSTGGYKDTDGGIRLQYRIDGGSWVQFQEVDGSGTGAWTFTAPSSVNCSTSYELRAQMHGSAYPQSYICLLYTSPSPRDRTRSRMPSSA